MSLFKSWQDWVFGVGGILLGISLIPAVLASNPPPLVTCAMTGAILWTYCVAFGSLKLRLSTAGTLLSAAIWTILAVQAILL